MDPPRSLIELCRRVVFNSEYNHPCRKLGTPSSYSYFISTWVRPWSAVPDLKANQADEGQPTEDKPTQSSDHYDEK